MSRVALPGCRPEPLASYLKALAVLRLVAEQRDPEAKGWWESDCFQLDSALDASALLNFFLCDYAPTPIVSPWNQGSGFYDGDDASGIDAIASSTWPRLAPYRAAIEEIRSWPELPARERPLGEMVEAIERAASAATGKTKKKLASLSNQVQEALRQAAPLPAERDPLTLSIEELAKSAARRQLKPLLTAAKKLRTEFKRLSKDKDSIVLVCRARLGEAALAWIDAATAIRTDGKPSYPPILGSGANEGRLEYSNVFMRRISELLLSPRSQTISPMLLRNALFAEATAGFTDEPVGQHDPGRAGGFNQGPGIENKKFPNNPWNFVLAMEGASLWAGAVVRRQGVEATFGASPFTVRARAVGYGSSSEADEEGARAEIWAPLWHRPSEYRELRAFISEGRAEVGRRWVTNGVGFAQAVASLAVDRGVSAFLRYSLLKRRGDSYVALPAGLFPVQLRAESDLVRDELQPALDRLERFMRGLGQQCPASLRSARHAIDQGIFDLMSHGGRGRVKDLVAELGKLEQLLARRDPTRGKLPSRPLTGLGPRWLDAADDGSVEVRLAAALASIGPAEKVGPLRANLAPVDPLKPWQWAEHGTQTAWLGNSLPARMASVVGRRLMDAERLGSNASPLTASLRLAPEDVAVFINGDLDEVLLENLLFGFSWIRWQDPEHPIGARLRWRWSTPVEERPVPRSFALLKLLFSDEAVNDPHGTPVALRCEPSIVPLLLAGRVGEACETAQRRLFVSGLSPIRTDFPDGEDGLRLAAALLFPVGNRKLKRWSLVDRKETGGRNVRAT